MNSIKKDTIVCNPGILGSGILATNLSQKSNSMIQNYSKNGLEYTKTLDIKSLTEVYIMIQFINDRIE